MIRHWSSVVCLLHVTKLQLVCYVVIFPGSGAFKVFHPILFEKAVKVFKIWKLLESMC